MKHTVVQVALVSLVALLASSSGCTVVVAQIREPHTYSSEVYDAARTAPASEDEILNFLAEDTTDRNMWIGGVYECGHFAADLWWNAYMRGVEACMVWVKHRLRGVEQAHWLVKFRVAGETENYWLWVEPSRDEVVDEGDYTVQDTYCGEQAFNLCRTWWEQKSRS